MENTIIKGNLKMSEIIKHIVLNKLYQLTPDELLVYSKQYGFHISKMEAEQLIQYIKKERLNPFSSTDRMKMFHEISKQLGTDVANKAQRLFTQLIKQNGLEHLFME